MVGISKYIKRPRIHFGKLWNKIKGFDRKKFMGLASAFKDKKGLEIGGPSPIFLGKGYLPVYTLASQVDGVNFSNSTVWEGEIAEGNTYQYADGHTGWQYICEGNDLRTIGDNSYDFVLSSHNLEHYANPMKAIAEWHRVLKPGGALLMILPDRRFTFDHRRSYTGFDHLLEDYKNNTGEDDLTHLEEILEKHDRYMDPPSADAEFFRARSLKNIENRCLHHHVFNTGLLNRMLEHFDFKLVYADHAPPYHVIVMGQKKTDV
jgi:SAM-dependent methyltransferase